jgi:hypothetical protein
MIKGGIPRMPKTVKKKNRLKRMSDVVPAVFPAFGKSLAQPTERIKMKQGKYA